MEPQETGSHAPGRPAPGEGDVPALRSIDMIYLCPKGCFLVEEPCILIFATELCALGQATNLSEPQFSYLHKEENNGNLQGRFED